MDDLSNNTKVSNEPVIDISHSNQNNPTAAELNRIKVFRHIEATEPTSIYRIAKEIEMSYTTVSYIVRDLIFAGVICERMVLNKDNVAFKELTIPKPKEVKK